MNKKGWSIIELLTAVGIIGVLSSIAIVSYMKYYQKGQFTKIHETARNFSSAVQVCLLKYEHDPKRCASFDRLKFKCDYCASTVWFRAASVFPSKGQGNCGLICLQNSLVSFLVGCLFVCADSFAL